MRKTIIGVMGAGDSATDKDNKDAFELGKLISQEGWVVLSGGRNSGVMDAVNQGAKSVGGLTVGILPYGDNDKTSSAVDIPVLTNMMSARNNINVLSSDIVIACGHIESGTLSEIALAIKNKKSLILINNELDTKEFLQRVAGDNIEFVSSPQEAIDICKDMLLKQKT